VKFALWASSEFYLPAHYRCCELSSYESHIFRPQKITAKANKVGSRRHTIVVANVGSDKNRYSCKEFPDGIIFIYLREEFRNLSSSLDESDNSDSSSDHNKNHSKSN
jgi:hypothetical protein